MDNQVFRVVKEMQHENLELKTRNNFLEAEVDRLQDGKRPELHVVGDLEMMTVAREKFTQVYCLYGEDVRLLDLDRREPLMSWEKLQCGGSSELSGNKLI